MNDKTWKKIRRDARVKAHLDPSNQNPESFASGEKVECEICHGIYVPNQEGYHYRHKCPRGIINKTWNHAIKHPDGTRGRWEAPPEEE